VTCAILGPAGPQRSRILANLYRDDRTTTSLAPYRSSILRKMFLDQILRVDEIREFEKDLAPHQLATLELDRRMVASTQDEGDDIKGRRGAVNVLDRAVMEHNVLACAKASHFISEGTRLG
jgi:COP9 signalosome complex subunit 4